MVIRKRKDSDEEEDEDDDDDFESGDEEVQPSSKRAKTGTQSVAEAAAEIRKLGALQDAQHDKLRRKMNNGGSTEGGLIRGIYLENFLCHTRLSFTFGPNMNFIIGHNGSGKSAVLTGLVVVLGGKSNSTGRANGVKDFVKSGTDKALIRVTLRNDGGDPFRQDEFGDSIDIERTITKEGQTHYKIKGHGGRKAYTGKAARLMLRQIIDHYEIQVDNPMTVLNQDQSRHFLANADESKKYALFMEGTQLKQLADAYTESERLLRLMKENVGSIENNVPTLKEDAVKWSKELKSMENATAMKARVLVIKEDLAWAYPVEKKQELEVAEREKIKEEKRLEAANEKVEEAQAKEADHNTAMLAEEEERTRIQAEVEEFSRSIADMDHTYKEGAKKIRETEANLKNLNAEIKSQQALIKSLEAKQEEEMHKNGHDELQRRRHDLMHKKAELQTILEKIEREIPIIEATLKDIYERRSRIQLQMNELQEDRQEAQSRVQQLDSQLSALRQRQGGGDPLSAFGRNIRAVYDAIERTRWAHSKPIGPLGVHVSIKQGEAPYQRLLDTMLSGTLTSWAVRDGHDKRTLLKIFQDCIAKSGTTFFNNGRETRQAPTIIEHAGELFDYTNGDFRHLHPTVLSKLEINNEEVHTACTFSNLVFGHTADGSNMNRTGGLQSTVINSNSAMSLLSRDVASEINSLQQIHAEAQATFRTRSQEFDAKRSELQAVEAQFRDAEQKLKKLQAGQVRTDKEVSRLEGELEQAVPADLSVFEEGIEKQREKQASQVEQLVLLEAELDAEKAAQEPARIAREKARAEIIAQRERMEAIDNRVAQAERIRKQAESDKAHYVKKKNQIAAKVEELVTKINHLQEEYDTWRDTALRYTEGVERAPTKKPATLKAELTSAENALTKSSQRHRYSLEHVETMVHNATAVYEAAEQQVEELRKLHSELAAANKRRKDQWVRMREDFSAIVKVNFHKYCARRNFTGEVDFFHHEQKLKMKVQTEEIVSRDGSRPAMNKHNSKDPRALSGGETSFATICLLLSIWECVACPLRCLDEFDVFMDAHNRRLAMSLLMEAAKFQTNRQYILITPQDMAGVAFGPGVKAHKMPDPERGVGR
ncbi:hypothetical protein QFC22_000936 [Naganishia vaughanmartiniae]|uniref:Uncharacterized protein n=1 Tax=Naganishia vaughanmartiniae TaxID=1424756 RepID=A0ACC2XL74_9TREE|nr:hypothetical protein QFC22_000936 [Naganishia vaughanmartiniae]